MFLILYVLAYVSISIILFGFLLHQNPWWALKSSGKFLVVSCSVCWPIFLTYLFFGFVAVSLYDFGGYISKKID